MSTVKKKSTKKSTTPRLGPKRSSWVDQAGLEALLKFAPQESALQSLYTDAQATYRQQSAAARFFQEQAQRAITAAQGQVDANFKLADDRQNGLNAGIQQQLAALGPAGGAGAGAALGNISASGIQMGAENKAFKDRLAQQGVDAVTGGKYEEQQAQGQLAATIEKILGQRSDIANQKGAFTQLTYDKLHQASIKAATSAAEAQKNRDATRGNALIGKGLDPSGSGERLKGLPSSSSKNHGKVSATGVKLVDGDAHLAATKANQRGWDLLRNANRGDPRGFKKATDAQLIEQLTTSIKGGPVFDEVGGKQVARLDENGQKVSNPDFEGLPRVVAKATVEQYRRKRITRATARALAEKGYSIKRLGYVTEAQYAKKKAAAQKKRNSKPHGVADAVHSVGF